MSPKFEQTPRTSQKGEAFFYMTLNIWIPIFIIVSTNRVLLLYYSGAAETEDRAPQWSSASRPQRHGQVGGQGHGQVSQSIRQPPSYSQVVPR